MPRIRAARLPKLMAIALAVASVTGCVAVDTVEAGLRDYEQWVLDGPLYSEIDIPADAEPGQLLRSQPILFAPAGAHAWKVIYVTSDLDGVLVPASGVVVVPGGDAPRGGFPVVSWAHPTTGSARRCAPSVGADPTILIEGVGDLLRAGYAITAADYPGMGAPGPNSYLVGATTARSVLDIVVAARALPNAALDEATALWGHSQGGQAVLFAALDASAYAPAIDLRGAAVAAPAVELATLLADDIDDVSGVTIASYAFTAYADVYASRGADLAQILTPDAQKVVGTMAELCLFGQNSELHRYATPLIGHFLAGDPSTTEPWATLLAENTPAAVSPVPLFVAQGLSDTLVRPASTRAFVREQCAQGVSVTFDELEGVGHGGAAEKALPELLPWLEEVFSGDRPDSTC